MPYWDMKCEACENVWEELILKPEKEKDVKCPKCNSTQVKKLASATGAFRLYGKGFTKQTHRDTGDFAG